MGGPAEILAARGAAPGLDPMSTVSAGLASNSPEEAAGMAAATAGYGTATKLASTLRSTGRNEQLNFWKSATAGEQAQLDSVGYKPPPTDQEMHDAGPSHPGILGTLLGWGADAVHDVEKAYDTTTHAVGVAAHDTLNAAGSGLRFTQHLVRAGQYIAEAADTGDYNWKDVESAGVNLKSLYDPRGYEALFSPGGWAKAWNATANGQTSFDPVITRHLAQTIDPSVLALAKDVAGGMSVTDAVNQYAPASRLKAQQWINTAEFKNVVTQLQNSRFSLGQEVVGEKFLTDHPALGHTISGALDATFDIAGDPFLQLGKAAKAGSVAQYGLDVRRGVAFAAGDSSAYQSLISKGGPQRWIQYMGSIIQNDGLAAAGRVDPRIDKMLGELSRAKVTDADSLETFLRSNAGLMAILKGNPAMMKMSVALVPHLSPIGFARLNSKIALTKSIDWLAEQPHGLDAIKLQPNDLDGAGLLAKDAIKGVPSNMKLLTNPDPILDKITPAAQHMFMGGPQAAARAFRKISTLTPSAGFQDLYSDDVSNLRRMLQPFLPAHHVNQIIDAYIAHGDEGKRFDIYKGAINTVLQSMGIADTEDAQKISEAMDQTYRGEAYAPLNYDRISDYRRGNAGLSNSTYNAFASPERAALLENQISHGVYMPTFKELHAMSRRVNFYGRMGMGVSDRVDAFMKLWRASVLLRPGFALRVSMDEALSNAFRNGLSGYIASRARLSHVYAKETNEATARQSLYDTLTEHGHQPEIEGNETEHQATLREAATFLGYRNKERSARGVTMLSKENIDTEARDFWRQVNRKVAAKAVQHSTPLDPNEERIFSAIYSNVAHVPREILQVARNGRELATAAAATAAHGAYRAFGGDLTREDLFNAAQRFHDHEWNTLNPMISSTAHAGGGGYDSDETFRKILGEGGKPTHVRMRLGGHSVTTSGESSMGRDFFRPKFHYALDQYAGSKLSRAVLENIDDREAAKRAVLDVLGSDDFAGVKTRMARSFKTGEGKMLGRDATQEQIDEDWANKVVAATNALVRKGAEKGDVNYPLVHEMLATGHAPDMHMIARMRQEDLPQEVFGPDYVEAPGHERLIQAGFRPLTRMIDYISRQPITLQAYARSSKNLAPWVEGIVGKDAPLEVKNELLSNLAREQAFRSVKPFVHSPELRTQFEVMHRTAMPFLFAQDQFLKRWARTFIDSPAAVRKAQMLANGIQVSGFTQKDASGNEFFYYPGMEAVRGAITRTLGVFGLHTSLPVSVGFTGEVKNMMPGLNNPATPSVGPFVAVPMKELGNIFPEMQTVNQNVLQQGASEAMWQQFLPSTLSRTITALGLTENTSNEFATAMMKSIQQLEADGHGLPYNASPQQQEQFLNRVRQNTRILLFTKAALGFFAPASPSLNFDPSNFNGRLQELFNTLPYDQAISEFLREHPKATPYTVFTSQTTGDVPNLPATQAAGDFMQANREFLDKYPKAAGWFIPRTTGNQPFDAAVYREQLLAQAQMRVEKPPSQFLQDVLMAPAASKYYALETQYINALNHATGSTAPLTAAWQQYKSAVLAANPAFADYLTGGGRAVTRVDTIRELNAAANDPLLPKNMQTNPTLRMLQAYNEYQNNYEASLGDNSSAASATRKANQTALNAWAQQFTAAHPNVADLWNVLFQPELGKTGAESGLI